MKRTCTGLCLSLALVFSTGCNLRHLAVPGAPIPFAKANYVVMPNTNAEECGTYIFGIDWAHLFANESASISTAQASSGGSILGALLGNGMGPEASRALYMALDKIPEATHLLSPRVHTTTTGLVILGHPIFGTRCSIVDARGVIIGKTPIPAAQVQ